MPARRSIDFGGIGLLSGRDLLSRRLWHTYVNRISHIPESIPDSRSHQLIPLQGVVVVMTTIRFGLSRVEVVSRCTHDLERGDGKTETYREFDFS